ncbi:MAG TPA: Ku protein [Longimicrobium sp.]|nr:Ku protein [Longimicrobium sp.]
MEGGKKLETFGRRLASALQWWGGTKSQFTEEMKTRGIRGSSLPSLASYLNDEVVPRLEWQLAAAEILGIRASWLGNGEGEARAADQAITDQVASEASELEQYMRGILDAAPWLYDRTDATTKLLLGHAAMTSTGSPSPLESGRRTIEAVLEPLRLLELPADQLPNRVLSRYLAAVAHTLASVNADLGEQAWGGAVTTPKLSVWSSIRFGLVHIPVELFITSPVDSTSAAAAELRTVASGDHQSPWIEIIGFISLEEIEISYLAYPHYLGPLNARSSKGYALFREALRHTRRAAVGVLALPSRDYLCMVVQQGDALLMEILRSPRDIRAYPGKPLPEQNLANLGLAEKELGMAIKLIEGMQTEWAPASWAVFLADEALSRRNQSAVDPELLDIAARLAESINALPAERRAPIKDVEAESQPPGTRGRTPARVRRMG